MKRAQEKAAIKRAARECGFSVSGDYLFARKTNDIVSGLVIDAPPSQIHISTFILPVFDNIDFIHMGLGGRVAHCGSDGDCFDKAYGAYVSTIGCILSASDLFEYIEKNKMQGGYSKWARLICKVRSGDIQYASRMIAEFDESELAGRNRDNLRELRSVLEHGGWHAVESLLAEWSQGNDQVLRGASECGK